MTVKDLPQVFRVLRQHRKEVGPASVTEIAESRQSEPYRILISCLISLRTKDEVTATASASLFSLASTPSEMVSLSTKKIARAIYPCGFYRTKADTIREVSREILARFDGTVPSRIEDLLTFHGVGRKTANLVVTLGYGKPGICVDTHVHRITNRWGLVATTSPDATETALRQILPRRYWIPINDLLVNYGKGICRPVSPLCSQCGLEGVCGRIGVERSR